MSEYDYYTVKITEKRDSGGDFRLDLYGNRSSGSWKHFASKPDALDALSAYLRKNGIMGFKHKFVRHKVRDKPRDKSSGAKVGTWAWACEQMLAGKEVRMAGGGRKYAIANGLIASHLDPYGWHTLPGVFTHMLRGTEWRVVT